MVTSLARSFNFANLKLFSGFHRKEARSSDVHEVPNVGAGEGVSLQPVPDQATEDRNRARPLSDGTADQDLVPEQTDEMEKREQDQGRARVRRWRLGNQPPNFAPRGPIKGPKTRPKGPIRPHQLGPITPSKGPGQGPPSSSKSQLLFLCVPFS